MSEDTSKKNCASCKYYVPEPQNLKIGSCHRFPPQRGWQIQQVPTGKIGETGLMQVPDSEFPLTQPRHWCGEYVASGIGTLEGNS